MEPVSFSRVSVAEHSEELFAPATRRTCAIFRELTHHGQVVELIFHVVPASVHDMVALAHPVQRSRCVLHHRLFRPTTSPAGLRRVEERAKDGVTQVTSSGRSQRALWGAGAQRWSAGRVCFGARPTDALTGNRFVRTPASPLCCSDRSVWGVTVMVLVNRIQKK